MHADADRRLARRTEAELRRAASLFEAAAARWLEAGAPVRAGDAWGGAGEAFDALGDQRRALATSARALDAYRAAGDRAKEQEALVWVAIAQAHLGEVEAALASYRASLTIAEERGDRAGVAYAWRGFGFALFRVDRWTEAIDAGQRALAEYVALGDRAGEATVRNNLGSAYAAVGDPERSLAEHERALALRRELGDPLQIGWSLTNIGHIYVENLGQPAAAIPYFEQALALWRPIGGNTGIPHALTSLGLSRLGLGQVAPAIAALEEALAIWRQQDTDSGPNRALIILARAYTVAGRLDEAARTYDRAIAANERLATPSWLASALAGRAQLLRLRGDDDGARRDLERAIATIESMRAGIALGSMKMSYFTLIRDTYDQLADLHAAAGRATEALAVTEQARARVLLDRLALTEPAPPAAASAAAAATTSPAAAIQAALGPSEVLVEVLLGRERSWAFVVTGDRVGVVRLVPGPAIEAVAGELVAALTSRNRTPPAGTDRARWIAAEDARATRLVGQLAALVVTPLRLGVDRRRVVLALDGALHVVPMRLVLDAAGYADRDLVQVPSASVLTRLHQRPPVPSNGRVVVLADPVFVADDARVGGAAPATTPAAAPDDGDQQLALRAARGVGLDQLSRLAQTRREGAAIQQLAPERVTVLEDFDATTDALATPAVAGAEVVHFATHGLIGTDPDRTGLVLSLVRPDGQPRPGFLSVPEVERLRLAARLVVLSACQTGLGKAMRGEGIVGLVHAFLQIGTAQVVATLWPVDDAAMAALMSHFYAALLSQRRSPADALRAAQHALARDPRFRAPYFWAGVTLHGRP